MRKITLADLMNWSGEDTKEEVLQYLLALLNNDFSITSARLEILDFNCENEE